jgi:hypothetical protein
MQRLMWVFPIVVLNTATAVTTVEMNPKQKGIAFEHQRVVIGALTGLRVVGFNPVRERNLDGVSIVHAALPTRVVRAYLLEFERLGLVRASKIDDFRRTTLIYRDAERTFRAVFTNRGRETEVRVFVT